MHIRLPLSKIHSVAPLSRAICLIAAGILVGCASRNPLMEEPAAKASPAPATAAASAPATTSAPAQASAAPAAAAAAPQATPPAAATSAATPATPAASAKAAAPAATAAGVQTTQTKRLFGIFSPYRIDVQQGNFISQEQLSQLKNGMTPEQVRFVLGTPLLTDIFHANRWDYVFRIQKGNGEVISSRIAVHFQDNRVASIDAAELPTEEDYLQVIAGKKK